jgi:large subunit ribosomal protein L4
MISVAVYNQAGQDTGAKYEFDPAELAGEINKQLLHDAVVMYQANLRQGTSKTKTRSEVAGSSHKLYRQKGTGNARAGNKRTPVRRGGGHAFAKRPKDWSYRMPRKALQIATRMAVLGKFQDNEVTVVDSLTMDQPKTKVMAAVLKALGVEKDSCLLAIDEHSAAVWRSARNIPTLSVSPAADLNALKLLEKRRLVVTTKALDQIRGKVQGG